MDEWSSTSFRDILVNISKDFEEYRQMLKTDSKQMVHELVLRGAPRKIREMNTLSRGRKYKIKGSVGQGYVTAAPWIAIMDNAVTKTPTKEYYVVYLYSVDLERVYLSLAFGVTAFSDLWGDGKKMRDILAGASKDMSMKLNLDSKFKIGKINLDSTQKSKLHVKYELSNIAAIEYNISKLPDDDILEKDLGEMLNLYTKIWRKKGVGLDEKISEEFIEYKDLVPELIEFRVRKKPALKNRGASMSKVRHSKQSLIVGNAGEKVIYEFEKNKLKDMGRLDLAEKVRWVADEGEKPGWDIESYDENGSIMRIEVKASKGKINNIIITENEKNKAEKYRESFFLALVENVFKKPTIEYICDPMQKFGDANNPSPLSWKMNLWN